MPRELTLLQSTVALVVGASAVGAFSWALLLFVDGAPLRRAAAFVLGGLCLWLWSGVRLLGGTPTPT